MCSKLHHKEGHEWNFTSNNLSASSISKDVFVGLLALSLSLSSSQVVSARFQLSLSFISFPFSTGCVQFKVELFEVRRHFMI